MHTFMLNSNDLQQKNDKVAKGNSKYKIRLTCPISGVWQSAILAGGTFQ